MDRVDLDDLTLPSISCIIPTYKRPRSLRRLLDILADQKHVDFNNMEAFVVNDGSHSGEYDAMLDGLNPPYHCVYVPLARRDDGKPAYDACLNLAVRRSQHEVVLILDDGLIIDDHTVFIHQLYHMFLRDAAIYPHECYPDQPHELQASHAFKVSAPHPKLIDIFVTMGGNSMRREDWLKVNGLDEIFDGSLGFDDQDMAIRLHQAGVRLVWADGITRMNEDSETGGSWTAKLANQDDHRNGDTFAERWPEYVGHNWGVAKSSEGR